jgi:uncharacterized membrane protein HdeD (DUF308 family)
LRRINAVSPRRPIFCVFSLMKPMDQRSRRRRAFSCGIGVLVTALGVIAIVGSETTHTLVAWTVGLILCLGGLLGLASLLVRRAGEPTSVIWIWSLIALAAGAALMVVPAHGIAASGALLGLMMLGHGGAAAVLALSRWPSRDVLVAAASLATAFLAPIGLALWWGQQPGDRAEEMLIGIDMMMFGAYVIAGRELIDPPPLSGGSPSRSAR